MRDLGLDVSSFDAELTERLANKKQDDGADDQLLGEASKLTQAQYSQYM